MELKIFYQIKSQRTKLVITLLPIERTILNNVCLENLMSVENVTKKTWFRFYMG
jgi:hypothetical protein